MQLRPCPSCRRHVADEAIRCVFCMAELPPAPERRPDLPGRFSRAAVFAGATLAAAGCSAPQDGPAARPAPTVASSPTDLLPADAQFAQPPPDDTGDRPAEHAPPVPIDAGVPPTPDAGTRPAITGGALHVRLRDDKTGTPITGVYIYIWLPDGNARSELTDATGTARFDGLAKGTYKVRRPAAMLIDGNNEAGIDGQKDEQVRVTGTNVVELDRRLPVRRTSAVRAPIPKPYGAPPARRRTV
jgi:hypothetical protein